MRHSSTSYIQHTPHSGFSLSELALAVVLYGAAQLALNTYNGHQRDAGVAQEAGRELSVLMQAIDRRFDADGYGLQYAPDDAWGASEMPSMLREELVGADNQECGVVDGWHPVDQRYAREALIPCSSLHYVYPNGLRFQSERRASSDDSFVSNWTVHLYLSTDPDARAVRLLNLLIQDARTATTNLRSGAVTYSLIDMNTSQSVETTDCFDSTVICGVEATFTPWQKFDGVDENLYLADGSLAMEGDLEFRSGLGTPSCTDELGEPVPCGFKLESDTLDLIATDSIVTDMSLASASASCDGGECGVVVNNGVVSHRYNDLVTESVLVGDSSSTYAHIGEGPDSTIKINGQLRVSDNSSNYDFRIHGDMELEHAEITEIAAKGEVHIGDVSGTDLHYRSGTLHLLDRPESPSGSSCLSGELTMSSTGGVYTCQNGTFRQLGGSSGSGPQIGSGAVLAFNTATCPSGWTSETRLNNKTNAAPSAGAFNGNNRHDGRSSTYAMTTSTMPTHTHNVTLPKPATLAMHPNSYSLIGFLPSEKTFYTNYTGSSNPSAFNILPSSYHMNYCRKL